MVRFVYVHSYLFWTDWGHSSYIGRVNLDGTNKLRIISASLVWPNGLTVDVISDRIWWTDANLHYIGFVLFALFGLIFNLYIRHHKMSTNRHAGLARDSPVDNFTMIFRQQANSTCLYNYTLAIKLPGGGIPSTFNCRLDSEGHRSVKNCLNDVQSKYS